MKRRIIAILSVLLVLILASSALAELCLVSPVFQTLDYFGIESFEGGDREQLGYDAGIIFLNLMRFDASNQDDVVFDCLSLEELMPTYYENISGDIEQIEIEPIAGYPTRHIHFETSGNEDSRVIDVVSIQTPERTFVLRIDTVMDAYYDYFEGYENGEAVQFIDELISSLDIFEG